MSRSPERIRFHYDIERELATRLMSAGAAERPRLYIDLYDELFRRVPDHPQLTRKASPAARRAQIARQVAFLKPYLPADGCFLEIGPGDCALSFGVAPHVRQVIGVDVSELVARAADPPDNFELRLSDGARLPIASGSVGLAFSDQLMEHLHPDDAQLQLEEIARVLKPGGLYICITPNRLSGPHDVTRYFDEEAAKGFHLREYSTRELVALFDKAGFRRITALIGGKGAFVKVPPGLVIALEDLLQKLSLKGRRKITRNRLLKPAVSMLIGVRLIATRAA